MRQDAAGRFHAVFWSVGLRVSVVGEAAGVGMAWLREVRSEFVLVEVGVGEDSGLGGGSVDCVGCLDHLVRRPIQTSVSSLIAFILLN